MNIVRRVAPAIVDVIHVAVVILSLAGPALVLFHTFRDDAGSWSLNAWRDVFGDLPRWAVLIENTSIVSLWALLPSVTVGTALALLLFKFSTRFHLVGLGFLVLAASLPLYVVNGSALSVVGVTESLYSRFVVGVVHAIAYVPIVALIVGAAVRSVDADAEEQALVEGCSRLGTILHVTLPLALHGLVASLIVVLLWVITDYSVADVLQVRTFAEEVYTQYALYGQSRQPALVCLPQMTLFAALLWVLRNHFLSKGEAPYESGHRLRFNCGRWRTPGTMLAVGVPLLLALSPVLFLFDELGGAQNALRVAYSFIPEIRTSVLVSFSAAIASAMLSLCLSWHTVRGGWMRIPLIMYVVVMLAVPAPIVGVGMIGLFNRPGLLGAVYDSPAILAAAYVFRFLPIAVILMIPAIRRVSQECELAARIDGCDRLAIWTRIVWPQCRPTALLVVFAVAVLSLGELPCSQLVSPPGTVTVGTRFFSLIHYGLYPDAAMLCLLSMALVFLPAVGVLILLRQKLLD